MIYVSEGNLKKAEEILIEGLTIYPLSFDLLYNLGYVFEQRKDFFEAYHLYMKARYVAEFKQQKEDIVRAFEGIKAFFGGSDKNTKDEIVTIVKAGDTRPTVTLKTKEILKHKEMLHYIERNIGKNVSTVLEIGFEDGIICTD
ncbi:MAG: hypothetical protein GX962_14340 [Epulopiscium sp.]|nr:hypothetical protein [Candidatus Epulonipiscium sp.]